MNKPTFLFCRLTQAVNAGSFKQIGKTWIFDEAQAQEWYERQQSISERKVNEILTTLNLRKD